MVVLPEPGDSVLNIDHQLAYKTWEYGIIPDQLLQLLLPAADPEFVTPARPNIKNVAHSKEKNTQLSRGMTVTFVTPLPVPDRGDL